MISGHKEAVDRAMALAKARGAKRALPLPVSAPFHCTLMQPAAVVTGRGAGRRGHPPARLPVVVNARRSGAGPDRFRDLLVAQSPGRCAGARACSMDGTAGETEYWEIGAGKALSGMIKRIVGAAQTRAIGLPEDVAALTA